MAFKKTEGKSESCSKTLLPANPSYRRFTLLDTPTRNPWSIIFSTTQELLEAISIPIDNECAENVNEDIPQADGLTDKAQKISSSQTTNDKQTDNHATTTAAPTSPIVPLELTINQSTIAISPSPRVPLQTTVSHSTSAIVNLSWSNQFKSYLPDISTQQDIDDELGLALSYQYMFDKRTSPWEMKDWDQDELNDFVIQPEMIDRLYHMIANDEDQNFRSWEICCRMEYKAEKYFVEMYANCDYTGFDCQGGGQICITKLPDFFLENMVTMDQNPNQIYRALLEDGYNVQEPDPLHKMHPKFWNNAPMLKYLCHNEIYKNKSILSHFKEQLPPILANSVDDFIKVKEWEYE